MKLENQVTSLELAKKLKELGVKQESLFYYRFATDGHTNKTDLNYGESHKDNDYASCVSAYTAAELGELLPTEEKDGLGFFSGKAINGWFCEVKNYKVMPYERLHVELQHDTDANARAKMLIYLIENDLFISFINTVLK